MSNAPLWKLQKEISDAIREVDKNHIIILEGNGEIIIMVYRNFGMIIWF
jgi:hypothetical protein